MRSSLVLALLAGALVMGYLVAGLFFLRFWRQSRDRLFAIFAAAFWLLALQRALLGVTGNAAGEHATWFFGLRLVAFVLILVAIVDKRARSGSDSNPGGIGV